MAVGTTSNYKDPRLLQHMLYQAATDWAQRFADDQGHGIVDTGRLSWDPVVVSVTPTGKPDRVEIADCVDDSHWLQVYKATGKLVNHTPGGRHRTETAVTYVDLTHSWMVTEQVHGVVGSC